MSVMCWLRRLRNKVWFMQAATLFEQNIFSVMRRLRYSPDESRLALDPAIFINGLPVITYEVKNR